MRHKLRNQTGLSLVEMMITLSVGSVVAVFFTYLLFSLNKKMKTAEYDSDMILLLNRVTEELQNPDSCNATVQGANGGLVGSTTILSSIKIVNNRRQIISHPQLKVRPSNTLVHSTPTITGLHLKHRSDAGDGGNFELWVTVTKSVKGENGSFIRQNTASKAIPLYLDNCQRYIAVTPMNSTTSCALDPKLLCSSAGGRAFGTPLTLTNAAEGIPNSFMFQGCRMCETRGTVRGCVR
jgi:prepilin-type N-terminal cleavage/methylation domain-containing protein